MEAAFFDLDKTVIAKASMVAFGPSLLDAGMINRWLMLRALWSHMIFQTLGADEERMRKFRESALRITRGWDQARISAIVRDALVEVIEPIVYDEALEEIRAHQAAGRRVYIVSASPEEIVAPLAQYLGVDEAIASRARLDEEGRYTGEVEFYSYGPFKAEAMQAAAERHGIDLASSYAYSDSATDLPMLEAVGHPIVVNPDRELAKAAREREWEVRTFSEKVPLRSRRPLPRPRWLAVAGAGVAVAGTAAGVTIWWLRRTPPPPPTLRRRVEHAAEAVFEVSTQITGRRTRKRPAAKRRRPLERLNLRPRPAASSPPARRGRARRGSR